ncbi:DUF1345 domain-containing protein [Phyllobacterium sp. 0TCS1.6C]|jgi:uncharacterized membrane protein|uniref:DUF1345 domain-containing protein n=1 Tax=unclassified Phyllobacterium TaxID=2638441 RepID=UPI0022651C4D|nr:MULTISPECIES: DUF1345 domain-containing protein [unclassified Phyllobacterium]MCX8282407.1 DUF1345 domain-containing protein [Phyllobacterium sp. 0TCS1.6C]MCX8295240.1 DUF1345 domain-containing protein [Phyllobacterium sp. 0TCS1.6A]
MSRHQPFFIGAIGGIAGFVVALWLAPRLSYLVAANLFFVLYLVLTSIRLPALTAEYLRRNAARSDVPVWLIFAVTLGAVIVAVGSLFALINSAQRPHPVDLALALASVPLGWLTIHMMAAIHYAHLYWQPGAGHGSPHAGGLGFPGGTEPGGIEFLYFSFVIGMTGQTSDTAITTTDMRKVNLVHSVVSFFFNTVLVAAAVNVAVSLGQ